MMLDFFADGELTVALDTDEGEEEDRDVILFGVAFQVRARAVAQGASESHPPLTVFSLPVPGPRRCGKRAAQCRSAKTAWSSATRCGTRPWCSPGASARGADACTSGLARRGR